MLNYLKKQTIINPNAYRNGRIGIVVHNEFEYLEHFNQLIKHNKELIATAFPDDQPLEFPITTQYLEGLLSGYKIEYHPFSNIKATKLEGFRLLDPYDESKIHVYYNIN